MTDVDVCASAVRRGADAYVRGGWGWVLRCRGERRSERAWRLRDLSGGVAARRRLCFYSPAPRRARGRRRLSPLGRLAEPRPRFCVRVRVCLAFTRARGGGVVCVMRVLASLGEGSERSALGVVHSLPFMPRVSSASGPPSSCLSLSFLILPLLLRPLRRERVSYHSPRLRDAFLTPPVPAASSNTYGTVPSTTICRERKVYIIPSLFLFAYPSHPIPTSSPPSFSPPSLSPPSLYVATRARTAAPSQVKSTGLRIAHGFELN
ncbi:hypothetical protein B0H16DRAFT_1542225 [Mycena metata]|uniref:Uncharacterized protein n=1 Tax=Mycena metata TaxID=1033252 RepID=A0AAD7J2J7_9AGAR|nr:hypothetical protein B0H16DRAFT_1542225 [Mycena metata]